MHRNSSNSFNKIYQVFIIFHHTELCRSSRERQRTLHTQTIARNQTFRCQDDILELEWVVVGDDQQKESEFACYC